MFVVEHRRCITALFYIVGEGKRFRNVTELCPPVDVPWNLTTASVLGSTKSPVWTQCRVLQGNRFVTVRVICLSWFVGCSDTDISSNTRWLRRGRFMKMTAMCRSCIKQVLTLITAGLWIWHCTVQLLIIWAGWFLIINYPKLKRN